MKIETAIKKVTEFLQNSPASTKEAIGTSTKVKGIELTNVIKALRKKELLIEEGEGKDVKFSLNAEVPAEPEPVAGATDEEIEPVVKSKGRNNDKYQFNGNAYGKGPLVREVVRQFVAGRGGHAKTTYKQLKEAFPDDLLKRFGILQDEDTARSLSGARDRYFFKEEHQIKLKDKIVVCCNQFTSENIQPFLKTAKSLGFKIK
ncbi:MAG: hypothetical protein U0T74_15050 [Chitinophagales bacterium]